MVREYGKAKEYSERHICIYNSSRNQTKKNCLKKNGELFEISYQINSPNYECDELLLIRDRRLRKNT
jgi:hypothetical protein